MSTKNWFLAVIEAIVWFGFIYYLLYSIKNPVNLWMSAVILLALFYIGTLLCPWFRQTKAFKDMLKK